MFRNRFQLIQRYFHFNDNNAAGRNEDHLYKIRTILDIVINNFRTNYITHREISLDDGMLGWQSRLQFRVYNPGKITKYGILVRMVCDSSTGYICNLQIYYGMLYYVTFSKNNPNSCKSFLDFMSDITENLINTSDVVSSPSSSSYDK